MKIDYDTFPLLYRIYGGYRVRWTWDEMLEKTTWEFFYYKMPYGLSKAYRPISEMPKWRLN